jgi:hypothetical protein
MPRKQAGISQRTGGGHPVRIAAYPNSTVSLPGIIRSGLWKPIVCAVVCGIYYTYSSGKDQLPSRPNSMLKEL